MKMRSEMLSATRIKMLHQCPMKFYLTYCAPYKVDMPESWGAANGSILHEVFEEYANGTRRDWRANLMEKFRLAMADEKVMGSIFKFSKGTKYTLGEAVKDGKRSCGTCPFGKKMADGVNVFCSAMGKTTQEFVGTPRQMIEDTISLAEVIFDPDFNPIDDLKILGVEQEFDLILPNGIRLYGFMDLVSEVSEDTIEIRDYKSAKRTPSSSEITTGAMKEDWQMQLYYMVAKYSCEHNIAPFNNKYKNILVTIHFLRTKPITIAFGDEDYGRIMGTLTKENEKIMALEKPMPLGMLGKDKFWICNYCNKDACEKACIEIHNKHREEFLNE